MIALLAVLLAIVASVSPALAWDLNSQESSMAYTLTHASGQGRPTMTLDPILSQVARARAQDMAQRNYFGHTNPDGHGANYLVRQAGYTLPSSYATDGNNIESIAGGYATSGEAWTDLMNSSAHREHLLGQNSFYAAQTNYGIGYYEDWGATYVYYWVIITAPPSAVPSSVTITSPGDYGAVYENSTGISGTTAGDKAASLVQVSVGGGAYHNMTGTTSWSGSLGGLLVPGWNNLTVRSLGSDGAVLSQTSRSVNYIVYRPLKIHVVGQGSVGGFLGTTSRILGQNYTITATPAKDWLFAGWSDTWGKRPTKTFTMKAGLERTATFVPNPFLAVRGGYNGLLAGDSMAQGGQLRLSVNGLGNYSGRLFLGAGSYALVGHFMLDGTSTLTIPRDGASPLTLSLTLDLTNGSGQVTGSVKVGADTIALTATHVSTLEQAKALSGKYTIALPANPSNTDPSVPQGDGYATLSMGHAGRVNIVGQLADGQPIVRTGRLAQDGTVSIYAPLYSRAGTLAGNLVFSDQANSDVSGTLYWNKPLRAQDVLFPNGFETTIDVAGSRYTAPTEGAVLAVAANTDNLDIIVGDGNLDTQIEEPATLGSDNAVTVAAQTLSDLGVKINASNGRFTGTFTHPETGEVTKLRGVVLQKANVGTGFFLGADQSGYASLAPAAAAPAE